MEMSEVRRLASVRHLGHLGHLRGEEGQVELVGDLKSLMLWVDL